LVGRKLTIISKYSSVMLEQEHRVKSVRRFLWAHESKGRKVDLLQFFAEQGGLRTVAIQDVVDVS
jgi:hypothetical protein